MASNNSSVDIYATSNIVLKAQKISNIIWFSLCIIGLIMGTLQVITILSWKPLRKMEQSLIFSIALGDVLKAVGYGIIAVRRLYFTILDSNEVITQRMCMVWILGMSFPTHFGYFLLVFVSLDRLLSLLAPIWYKNQTGAFKFFLIGISVLAGLASALCSFLDTTDNLVPACGFGTAPTERYRTFSNYFEDSMAVLTLLVNISSCATLIVRWKKAIKEKKDMKAFRKHIQLNALKTLFAVVVLYLLSTTLGATWSTLIYTLNWDAVTKMSYAPIAGCFGLIRGVFDFPIYFFMVQEYRKGFLSVIRFKSLKKNQVGAASDGQGQHVNFLRRMTIPTMTGPNGTNNAMNSGQRRKTMANLN